ncbi:lysozyme [uncultured Roseibium sp.]|uniref:lysozyme n=1 Tax=uncultured Roseibium sp. TaxID=1936171 RepID=UPI0026102C0A|nr:lysozyme [uncultured Roseibium sp.]
MQIIPEWRRVVSRSLSFWMPIVGLIVMVAPELRFALTGIDSDPLLVWWLGFFLIVAGLAGRLVRQDLSGWWEWLRLAAVVIVVSLAAFLLAASGPVAPLVEPEPAPVKEQSRVLPPEIKVPETKTAEASTLELAVPLIAKWEGKRNHAYQDIVGVWTICYGHTRTAKKGMFKTDEECTELLREEVAEYRHGLHGYFNAATKSARLTPERDTAYTSLAFNVGIRGAGRSTATRRLNAGNIVGGCEALAWWNKAGGRVVRGLVNRRADEQAFCMVGL